MAKEKDKKVTSNQGATTIKRSAECLANLRKGYCKPRKIRE